MNATTSRLRVDVTRDGPAIDLDAWLRRYLEVVLAADAEMIQRPSALRMLEALTSRYLRGDYTYFVACGNKVKIGRSAAPIQRIADFQTGNPEPLSTLAIVPSFVCTEEQAHDLWAHLWVTGEWFHLTADLRLWIDNELPVWAAVAAPRAARVCDLVRRREQPRRPLAQIATQEWLVEEIRACKDKDRP